MTKKRWYVRDNLVGPDGVELGYWESRWVEFKRLFKEMAWENDMNRGIFIATPIVLAVTWFGVTFLGWG
ncbi:MULTISPECIES: hypothetical protein [Dietzia]|uniref:hypothetical protein n=1 Tax=Dietzia TaxID=37914 RepID=UPI0012E96624|nr:MULTISPECIES: hypothetical protein [Dietzia]MBS7548595.1 hypothetical protein [Dietzia massiliensis]MCT1638326.1 hypothetical protein [Dietzia cinnamea]